MDIRVFHSYERLMDKGLAPIIFCGNDKNHTRPLVHLSKLDAEVEYFCLACDWTMRPGQAMYETMLKIIDMNWDLVGE